MTHQDDHTRTSQQIDDLIDKGVNGLPELILVILKATMKSERKQYLNAISYERSKKRTG